MQTMIYTTEPKIFKLNIGKGPLPPKFLLGSLSNWCLFDKKDGNYLVDLKVTCQNFNVPTSWDFRKGWYFFKNHSWYYQRFVGSLELKYRFDPINCEFLYYPRLVGKIPFIYNAFYPVGTEISNIISYQMIKKGYLPLKASAFIYKGTTFLLIAPSYNGKTTIVRDLLEKNSDAVFISEDLVFLSKSCMIGVPPLNVKWRRANKGFVTDSSNSVFKSPLPKYVIYYNVSSLNFLKQCKDLPKYPFSEIIAYFSESMVSSILYSDESTPLNNIHQDIYKNLKYRTTFYRISTNGYNSRKFIEYLDEIIK